MKGIIETEELCIFTFRDVFFRLSRVRIDRQWPTWQLLWEKGDKPVHVWDSEPSLKELKTVCRAVCSARRLRVLRRLR